MSGTPREGTRRRAALADLSPRLYLTAGTLLALLVAVGTVLLLSVKAPVARVEPGASAPQGTALVATADLKQGATISAATAPTQFAAISLPAAGIPATAFSSPAQLMVVLRAGSREATMPILRGQMLIASMLSGLVYPQAASPLANALPKDLVATTLAVPPLNAVGGEIVAGDHVKVIYSLTGTSGIQAHFLAEDSVVLATDPVSGTYTLALTPEQAALVIQLQDRTLPVHLLLRSAIAPPSRGVTVAPTLK